jgi:uncharacterized RDD family membrane protein YckC
MTAAHSLAPAGAMCAQHPSKKATFICARCGSFACSACKPALSPPGYCTRCAEPVAARASRGSRFSANLIDNIFVVLLPTIVLVVLSLLREAAVKRPQVALIHEMAAAIVSLLVGCLAELWAQVHWGQSIGKRLLAIKVVRVSGEPIELWRLVLLRNVIIHALAQLCGLVGLVDAVLIFGNDQRCLHDYLADSIVVEADKKGPAAS